MDERGQLRETDVIGLLNAINEAFSHRMRPNIIAQSQPVTPEMTDALYFSNKKREDITCEELEKYFDAMIGFTPEAFCYFLPGVLCASVRENCPHLIVVGHLIGTLDRSNMPSSWDEYFSERWPKLTPAECAAVQDWILWLTESEPPSFSDNSLSRAFDTLTLLANQQNAIPLASR